jgi:hypothetical protein
MTVAQMHQAFKLLCDKTDSLSYDEFTPKEIDFYLNLAQQEFVKERYREFEFTQKRRDDLRSLVTLGDSINLHTFYSAFNKNYIVGITDIEAAGKTYLFFLSDEIRFTDTTCNQDHSVYPKVIQIDDISSTKHDPFNNATLYYPTRIDRQDGFVIDFGSQISSTRYTPMTYQVTYLKRQRDVVLSTNTSSELPEHTHSEIVNLAVRKALENIESYNRYQSHNNEINEQE